MKIVIDIPEEKYDLLKDCPCNPHSMMYELVKCIENGMPLPKGYEQLIDVDIILSELKEELKKYEKMFPDRRLWSSAEMAAFRTQRRIIKRLEDASIIIEADMEVQR